MDESMSLSWIMQTNECSGIKINLPMRKKWTKNYSVNTDVSYIKIILNEYNGRCIKAIDFNFF
jgi:hypothetical protein